MRNSGDWAAQAGWGGLLLPKCCEWKAAMRSRVHLQRHSQWHTAQPFACHCLIRLAALPLPADCPAPCRQEVRELRATHNDAAGFLLQCFIEARQGLLTEQGHATLAAAASPTASQPDLQQQQQQYSNSFAAPQESLLAGGLSAVAASSPAVGQQGKAPPQVPLQLGQLSLQQRDALLQHMLDKLGAEWQEKEGLVLPATTSSLSSSMVSASTCYSPRRRAQQPAACSPRGSPMAAGCGGGEAAAEADGGSPASEELMRVLRTEVRPWGGKSAVTGPAVTHKLTAAGGAGLTLRGAAGSR